MAGTDWASLKVVELKEECKKRGLPVSGKKADLVVRLEEAEQQEATEPAAEQPEEEPAAEPEKQEEDEEEPAEGAQQDEEEREEENPAEEEPAAEAAPPAAEEPAEPQAMEAEEEPAAAAEPSAAEEEERREPSPADLPAEQKPAEPSPPAAAAEPAAAEPAAPAAPAGAADVDLDYGEESEGEGAAAPMAEDAPQQEAPRRGKAAEDGPKRKRDSPPAAGVGASAAAGASGGSADRPSRPPKLACSGSGFSLGTAEKGEAPDPKDVPEAGEPATRALRIDGFVRPFHERQVRELLGETGEVKALWMPSIKTHCYVVFDSRAQAEATRRATYQLQWPASNPKRLAPKFVPLSEAETAIGTGAGNPDYRIPRKEEDGEEEAPAPAPAAAAAAPAAAAKSAEGKGEGGSAEKGPDRSQREWNRNRRSPSPPLEGVRDLREMLSRRASGGGPAAAAAAAAGPRGGVEAPPGMVERLGQREPPARDARGERGRGEREAEAAPRQQERVLTLDELFRKTASKPCIYWLPLTDEQVAEKKRKAAEAAAAAAEAAGKPAENGTATTS